MKNIERETMQAVRAGKQEIALASRQRWSVRVRVRSRPIAHKPQCWTLVHVPRELFS